MFSLFSRLTSGVTEIRRVLVEERDERRGEMTRITYRNPLWINTFKAERRENSEEGAIGSNPATFLVDHPVVTG